ncbi:PIG-L deacetylase family protein, partial [Rhizobium leguminosarum]|uniref:PIG-L deacetylase family protein n=1 Tax=Rhizobium leguminosarum TaxID=384 RepID=UPI003F9B70A7
RVVDLEVPDHCAANYLADLTKRITVFLQQSAADIVVTHPYEGGHPDHDATAFATHAALRLMKQNGLRPPALFEMALHPSEDFIAKLPEFL